MFQRTLFTRGRLVGLCTGIALVGATPTFLFATESPVKGAARVIERRGPEVDVRANGPARVVVLFPDAAQSGDAGVPVEIVFVESQLPAPGADGQVTGGAVSTGREVLFSSRDADRGIVSHAFEQAGHARKMMILARIGDEPVEVRQMGGGEGVTVFALTKVDKPVAETPPTPPEQTPPPTVDPAATPADAAPAESTPADANTPEQPPTPPEPQPQPQQTQPVTPPLPQQAAIIVIYTGGGQP